jgi:UDP-N-acetylglucosamine--N-acetylmuramyl-(pentapeptide) pyrophosphoryl-undecaprenol N-acetylglucosamine transferase
MTGGGSGGHITPILAVASKLKQLQPDARLIYIGQTGDGLGDIPAADPNIDQLYTVRAGKFRRYHGEGWKQILDLKTMALNLRDAVFVVIGLFQSWRLIRRLQPDVLFTRGGFLSVPVAIGAKLNGVPYITHDSDSLPSLANRLIARWAVVNAVALPEDTYPYDRSKTIMTGIPLTGMFEPVDEAMVRHYRQEISVPIDAKVIFIIGGGLGSQRLNKAVAEVIPHLLSEFLDLYVFHGVGRANEHTMQKYYATTVSDEVRQRIKVFGYLTDVYRYSGAANVIVTRAGATNLAEFALQGKACVVIPSPFLTGGHQLKTAAVLAEQGAAEILDEAVIMADSNKLAALLSQLLRNPARQTELGKAVQVLAKPEASRDLAMVLLDIANKQQRPNETSKTKQT